jgi:oligopeptide/dipeptide ABC transporter ATP-binding protein
MGSITRLDVDRPDRLPAISGLPPSLASRPEGCHFRPRCPHEFEKCPEHPELEQRVSGQDGQLDRCWLQPEEKKAKRAVEGRIGLEAPAA